MPLEGKQPELLIGLPARDHIRLEVVSRAHPSADDYWDGNWVMTRVSIRAGGFRASYEACLRTDELKSFRDQLEAAYERLDRSACFESMEQWLTIGATGDGYGRSC